MALSTVRSLALAAMAAWIAGVAGCAPAPPQARVVPTRIDLGGQVVIDNYWWLRNKSDPAVIDYLKAENAYTDAMMRPAEPLEARLYREMLDRIREDDESVPYEQGRWWYSQRMRKGNQYPIYVRRSGSATAPPQVMIDVNELAAGHRFFDCIRGPVSDDGNLLAFATDVTGNRQYVLQVKDLRTGAVLSDAVPLVDSFEWGSDNSALYYVKEDAAKRAYRLYRHVLGAPIASDALVYEEKDELFSIDISRTRDKKYLVLAGQSKTTTEARFMPADGSAALKLIEPRRQDREYYVDHRNGWFYLRVNDTNRNFRIVTAPDSEPGQKNWSELVAARDDVVIQDLDAFAHHLVVRERRYGLPQLGLSRLPDGQVDPAAGGTLVPQELPFDEPDFDVAPGDNHEFDPPVLRYTYTSLTTPQRVYDLDLATGKRTLLKEQPVGGGFKAADYKEERLFATASDGTKVPICLVYRRSPADRPPGPRPLLLEGYGSYGIPSDVYFSSGRLSLLDRGMTFAVAHVRGGGEYGRAWYDAGRMQNKPNTFRDFIAVAQFLENSGFTSPDKLAIEGGSAGGLLIGAVVNQCPKLFHAAIADVPWVDVLADMCDPSLPETTLEYIEWGNPNVPAQRGLIASYCPYTNVRPQAYPAMLIRESLNDSQVQYWDAARWVAKLRAAKNQAGAAGRSELLLKMDMDAGHGGASGRYSQLHAAAFDDAWLLTRLGVQTSRR